MSEPQPRFCFVLPVWNTQYVNFFLDYALPSQLAPGNLECMYGTDSEYLIYTFARDIPVIESHPLFKRLSNLMPVRFFTVEDNVTDHRLRAAECFQEGINHAQYIGAVVIIIVPDVLYSRGSFKFMLQQLAKGYKAMLAPCHSVEITQGSALVSKFTDVNGVISLSGRDCIDIVLRAMHGNTKNKFYLGEGNLMPGSMCWYVGEQGILSHSFHLHPFMAQLNVSNKKFAGSIDRDFLIGVCPNPDDIYVVQDTDDFCLFEMVDAKHTVDAPYRKNHPDDVLDWAIVHANAQHKAVFSKPLRQKSSKFVAFDQEWQTVESQANTLVSYLTENLLRNKYSLRFYFKFKYAFLRRFLNELHDAERLQQGGYKLVLAKSLLGLHRNYLRLALAFNKFQERAFGKFFAREGTQLQSWLNLFYWPNKLFPKSISSMVQKPHQELSYNSKLNLDRLLQTWLRSRCLRSDKPSADKTRSSQLYNLNISYSIAQLLNHTIPVLNRFSLQRNTPVLFQMLQFPILYPLAGLSIFVLNAVIGVYFKLFKQNRAVNFEFYLL